MSTPIRPGTRPFAPRNVRTSPWVTRASSAALPAQRDPSVPRETVADILRRTLPTPSAERATLHEFDERGYCTVPGHGDNVPADDYTQDVLTYGEEGW